MSNSSPKLDSTACAVEKTPREATHALFLTLSNLLSKMYMKQRIAWINIRLAIYEIYFSSWNKIHKPQARYYWKWDGKKVSNCKKFSDRLGTLLKLLLSWHGGKIGYLRRKIVKNLSFSHIYWKIIDYTKNHSMQTLKIQNKCVNGQTNCHSL